MPVFRLDPFRLGEVLIQLGAISSNLGHSDPFETVRSYWHREGMETLEQRFVYDVLTQPNDVITERWYGGQLDARRMALAINLMATGREDEL
jgi:hypothetical protein